MNASTSLHNFCYPFCNHITTLELIGRVNFAFVLNMCVYASVSGGYLNNEMCAADCFGSTNSITINMYVVPYSLQSAISYVVTFNPHNNHMF